jgi:hypothetical protein
MEERVQSGDDGRAVQVRLGQSLFTAIERWRGSQRPVVPSRSQAIRELVQKSLTDDDSAAGRKGVNR